MSQAGSLVVLTAAYGVAVWSVWRAAQVSRTGAVLGRAWSAPDRRRRRRDREDRRRTLAWTAAAVVIAVAGLARITDGLDTVTALARAHIKDAGWYADRGPVQATALTILAAAVLLAVGWIGAHRTAHRRQRLAAAALGVLLAVLLARLVSWHASSAWLAHRIGGVRLATSIEVGALLALAIAGLAAARWRRRHVAMS